MNLSFTQEMCFLYQPSFGKDALINMGHTRLYSNSLRIDAASSSGTLQVALAGHLGSTTIGKLDKFLLEYKSHFKHYENISFDISQLEFINQFGVTALIDLVYVLKHEGLRISFSRAGNRADMVLIESGFHEWVEYK
jgi:anti-anti-sigma regulatory factor